MEENNLDKYFQEKLAGHSEVPPASVWEGIAANAPAAATPWYRKFFWLLLLLISFSGVAILGYWLYEMDSRVATLEQQIDSENTNSIEPSQETKNTAPASSLTETEVEPQTTEESKTESSNDGISAQLNQFDSDLNLGSPSNDKTAQKANTVNSPTTDSEKSNDLFDGEASKNSETETAAAIIAGNTKPTEGLSARTEPSEESRKANISSPNDENGVENEPLSETTQNSYSPFLREPLQPSLNSQMDFLSPIIPTSSAVFPSLLNDKREIDYYSAPKKSWYIFGYGMANYTHRRVVQTENAMTEIANELNTIENGELRPGGGLFIFRELNSSLRLGIGVEFNEWVQKADYSIEVPFEDVSQEFLVNTGTSEYSFEGNVESSFGATEYEANSDENYFNVEFATLSPEVDPLQVDISTKRTISYLTIPLTLEYVIDFYPWRFSAGGGISVNQILNSRLESTILPDSLGIEISEGEKIEGTYFAFQGGIGVEYMFNERMSLRLNPVYRGWMTPIFENEEFRTLPFGVALRGGMVYRLSKK
ncbi:MAG: hypothetical protein AAGC47_07860 [Bacteroidota bacterium]